MFGNNPNVRFNAPRPGADIPHVYPATILRNLKT